jgi:hypothetical protein
LKEKDDCIEEIKVSKIKLEEKLESKDRDNIGLQKKIESKDSEII